MNEQKILDTLKYIKDICEEYVCRNCPLSNDGICILGTYEPVDWVLNESTKKWNAFRIEDML